MQTKLDMNANRLKTEEQKIHWHDYDAGEDAWEDSHKGKWVK